MINLKVMVLLFFFLLAGCITCDHPDANDDDTVMIEEVGPTSATVFFLINPIVQGVAYEQGSEQPLTWADAYCDVGEINVINNGTFGTVHLDGCVVADLGLTLDLRLYIW